MQVLVDEKGYVVSYAVYGILDDSEEVDDLTDDEYEDFQLNYECYCIKDGKVVKDEDRLADIFLERKSQELRDKREKVCFPIVNRGGLWYDLLSEKERADLLEWYMAWLDATETLIEPEMPEWLREEAAEQ